jgi:dihydroorotase
MTIRRPHSLLIRGGRVIDPASGLDGVADIFIEGGRIVRIIRRGEECTAAEYVIDARGLIVAPGFVDIHTHLRYPGFTAKETIASGTAAAVQGGFTTLCTMANTNPPIDSVELLSRVQDMVRAEARCHVHAVGTVTRCLAGLKNTDARSLVEAGAIALSDDGRPIANEEVMIRALQMSETLGVPISVHEEAPQLVGSGVANASCAERHSLPPWPCAGEVEMVRRDLALLARYGGKLHIAHVSCAESVHLIAEARAHGLSVTAEATPHHLLLTEELVDGSSSLPPAHPHTKVNPPLRSVKDTVVVQQGLCDGVIDCVATDHAPHSASDKALPYTHAAFGFTGLELALPLMLELVRRSILSLPEAIRRLSSNPAQIFGLSAGTLQVGARADLCLFDTEAEWEVGRDTLLSKGKNSPLRGTRLRGRVQHCIVEGVVYTFGRDHVLRTL